MKALALVAVAIACVAVPVDGVRAQPGVYLDFGAGPPPYRYRHYRERYYYDDRDRYERRSGYRDWRGSRNSNPCRRGYTVQDGVCKPYRGY